jgi:CubicO group peptidase (beta-lactamase class C family)
MRGVSLLLLSLLAASASADQIDDLVREAMKKQGIPGLTLAVMRDGKPIKVKGYGFANLEHRVPARPETVYQSGSVGKQFTATLVMMLVQDGKLSLDDSISKWFPEGGEAWKPVLVRHLLSHTSGLPDMPYGLMDMRKPYTEDDFVKLLVGQKPLKAPGTEWRYNNGGYVMLGVLIHRLTGKFYGDLLQERIFRPLGMNTARIISEQDIIPNRAAGYEMTKDGIRNQTWVSPELNTTADGALYLTALDYAKWDAGLRTERLFPRSALETMWTPVTLSDGKTAQFGGGSYGFGWMIRNAPGHRFVEHGGAWQGFTTYIGRVVDKGYSVVVLTNLDAGHSKPQEIGRKVLEQYVPDLAPKKP